MELAEKLKVANEHKAKGNEYFKSENYKSALSSYNFAYLYLRGLDNDLNLAGLPTANLTPEQRTDIKTLTINTLNNISMCYLNLERYQDCINQCEKVLKLDQENPKAKFRMGLSFARMPSPDLQKAKELIVFAAKKSPQDVGIRTELTKVITMLNESNIKSHNELKENLKKSMQ